MKVIDSFMFFNEFDILKLRLEYLNDIVDHFIISECNYTHSGKSKPYHLDEIINDIPSHIRNKIIRLKYEPDISSFNFSTSTSQTDYNNDNWKLERTQRDYITQYLKQFSPNDLFMISDADEIPRKEIIQELIDNSNKLGNEFLLMAKCDLFYYNFNTFCHNNWAGTVFSNIQTALKVGCDYFRTKRWELQPIENGGWHFSYIGNTEKIRTKLQSFAHQEFNKDSITNDNNIKLAIESKKDLFGRNENFQNYNFNNFPQDLRNLITKIIPKDFYEMTEQEVTTKPEYLHNNMPPLLEAVLNPDGTGGTEIMGRAWQDYVLPVAPDLADWHWAVIPGDNTLSPDSSNIVWLHPHHMEEGIERLLDKEFQKHFKAYVFVSNWQYERFAERLQLPMEKCYVLKNATQPFEPHKKPEGKLQLMFHPNPIRGLDILLEAIKLIPEEDFELHIFHELDPDERKKQFQQGLQTYEYAHINPQEEQFLRYCLSLANNDKRVVRHTRTNNSKIREQLMNTHIFAYPTYFMETSCICMIEALAAGCSVLSSNLAALPETGLGFARHYGFIPDREKHIQRFTGELKRTITEYREGKFDNTRQVEVCNKYYSWETRVQDWVQFSKQLWRKG
jgi:beta-1,4-mannosyl-glycoprotein beta-1,4-N-acetylglucosaminyltransferase